VNDIFDETEENLRADQWVEIVKKALPWVSGALVVALLITLAVWGWQVYQKNVAASSSNVYEAAIDAKVKGDKATARTKFEEATRTGNSSYKALAFMELAAMAEDDNHNDEAIKDFDSAARVTHNPLLSDTAAYKAALLAIDSEPYASVEKRLTPLTGDKRPLAPLAKEALALAKLQNGDVKGARSDLQVLSLTLGAPDGLKQRAQAEVMAIDSGAVPTALELMKLPEAKAPAMPALTPDAAARMQAQ
jgi:hypothetical protein